RAPLGDPFIERVGLRHHMRKAVEQEASGQLFFFQAEDGIRDLIVTGVQTCALPISPPVATLLGISLPSFKDGEAIVTLAAGDSRSEERRVGKECRSRWLPYH